MEGNAEHALAQQNAVVAASDLMSASQDAKSIIIKIVADFERKMVRPSQGCVITIR
jgi:hypothetical protein